MISTTIAYHMSRSMARFTQHLAKSLAKTTTFGASFGLCFLVKQALSELIEVVDILQNLRGIYQVRKFVSNYQSQVTSHKRSSAIVSIWSNAQL